MTKSTGRFDSDFSKDESLRLRIVRLTLSLVCCWGNNDNAIGLFNQKMTISANRLEQLWRVPPDRPSDLTKR
ncbi:MAG: hypothetical protein WBD58_16860 [Geitlerinemataceae cyanobacterium]